MDADIAAVVGIDPVTVSDLEAVEDADSVNQYILTPHWMNAPVRRISES